MMSKEQQRYHSWPNNQVSPKLATTSIEMTKVEAAVMASQFFGGIREGT
jgi:hypothetical protein